jgi:8-oxo-dGTP diphosphatase
MSRHSIVPAVYLILRNKNNEYCLTRRFGTGYMDGHYSLPAGHLDGGESLKEAMIREAREEVGILVKPEDLKLVHISNNLVSDPERIDFFFECAYWEDEVRICEPEKCDDILWVNLQSLPKNTITIVKTALLLSTQNQYYSEYNGD